MEFIHQGKNRVMVGFLKKPLPGFYRFNMKEKTKGLDNYLWVEYGHNVNKKYNKVKLLPFPVVQARAGSRRGMAQRTCPTVWWRMKESTKAFGLVEALL
jgi:hypothetical protein